VLAKVKADGPRSTRCAPFEYMLIDVEVSGVRQIPMSARRSTPRNYYLQRCRLRLEEGVLEFDIPEVWWNG